MKRYLLFILTGVTLLWSTSSHTAGPPGSLGYLDGANDNPHNLSSLSGNTGYKALTETQICIFCHTPHSARSVAPLWGRPDSTATFGIRTGLQISDPANVNKTLYSTGPNYPNGATKVCLSCHDGVTAMGILANGNEIDMTLSTLFGRDSQIDLTTSHPVSFVYNEDVVTNVLGAAYIWPTIAYLDSESRVQCTICHQPHQDTRQGGTNFPFWRVGSGSTADYDTVCQSCHTIPVPAALPSEHNF